MKQVFLFALSFIFCAPSFSQIDLDKEMMNGSTLLLRKGMTLVYGVSFEGSEYDFIVHLNSFDEGIAFDYEMTNAAGTKGRVVMSMEALTNARSQNNYFEGGEMNLVDQTTIWVSKTVFNELISNKESMISPDGGNSSVMLQGARVGHDYSFFNAISNTTFNDLSYVYAESEDGKAKYWIHLRKYSPLILKMDLGWTIWLKELRKD